MRTDAVASAVADQVTIAVSIGHAARVLDTVASAVADEVAVAVSGGRAARILDTVARAITNEVSVAVSIGRAARVLDAVTRAITNEVSVAILVNRAAGGRRRRGAAASARGARFIARAVDRHEEAFIADGVGCTRGPGEPPLQRRDMITKHQARVSRSSTTRTRHLSDDLPLMTCVLVLCDQIPRMTFVLALCDHILSL